MVTEASPAPPDCCPGKRKRAQQQGHGAGGDTVQGGTRRRGDTAQAFPPPRLREKPMLLSKASVALCPTAQGTDSKGGPQTKREGAQLTPPRPSPGTQVGKPGVTAGSFLQVTARGQGLSVLVMGWNRERDRMAQPLSTLVSPTPRAGSLGQGTFLEKVLLGASGLSNPPPGEAPHGRVGLWQG